MDLWQLPPTPPRTGAHDPASHHQPQDQVAKGYLAGYEVEDLGAYMVEERKRIGEPISGE